MIHYLHCKDSLPSILAWPLIVYVYQAGLTFAVIFLSLSSDYLNSRFCNNMNGLNSES